MSAKARTLRLAFHGSRSLICYTVLQTPFACEGAGVPTGIYGKTL
ncbi:MAG TPA: hypothetical protein PKY59_25515 [Pyrinomonadaceae bacterium]|nr:hypothetical protein [Pyrinomonadaceae bacterium]